MLRRQLASATILAAILVLACESPTLPLPPPELPSQEAGVDADHIVLIAQCGGAQPAAVIVIVNTNPAVSGEQAVTGSLANSCGAWEAPNVYAHNGDVLEVTQEYGGVLSSAELVTVQVP